MTTRVYIENKNVLVMGGAGFIGSHLCEALVKKGDNVTCVDNFVSSDVENIRSLLEYPNFEFVRHDVTEDIDYASEPGLKKFKIEVQGFQEIYNLACPTSPKDYAKFPIKTAAANSTGVIKSLELAIKFKAKYLLSSSSAVYGQPPKDGSPVTEDYYGLLDFLGPRACYNEGKRFAETLVATYRDFHKLDAKIARLFGTYGPRMLQHSGRQVPDMIQAAAKNEKVMVAGNKETEHSLCYVKDAVEGMLSLMASDVTQPVNIGSAERHSLGEVAQKVITQLGSKSTVEFTSGYEYSLRAAIPDISRAKNDLNWFPLVSLDEGLQEAIDYYKATSILHKPIVGGGTENE